MIIDENVDSIIFDMDGTLWNATDSYAAIWNRCFDDNGIDIHVTGEELVPYMGKPLDVIVDGITNGRVGQCFDKAKYVADLARVEDEMMLALGGKLYAGVYEGLERLSRHYKLFMLSNCGRNGLHNFMQFTHTADFFSGSVSYGENPVPKSENIKRLATHYGLKRPVYVGDTQGDCDETHRAGIPFVYVRYGFGYCQDYDMAFDSFADLTEFFVELKNDADI